MKKAAIAFWLGQILLILFFWQKLPPEIPLFYSRPWGKEQLTTPFGLFILPSLSLTIILIHSAFIYFIPKEEKFISKILDVSTTVFNFLCLVTLTKIILLIT